MNTDTKIQELLKKVEEKKSAIKSAERPQWETNCSFNWETGQTTNLHIADVEVLVRILARLVKEEDAYNTAAKLLNISSTFSWYGFSYGQWEKDIRTRLNILQVSKTRKDLTLLENSLNDLMSPELKTKKRLEEIENLLKD